MIDGALVRWCVGGHIGFIENVISPNHKLTFQRFDELICMHAHKTKPKKIENKFYIHVQDYFLQHVGSLLTSGQ